jgi:hypothetical protein
MYAGLHKFIGSVRWSLEPCQTLHRDHDFNKLDSIQDQEIYIDKCVMLWQFLRFFLYKTSSLLWPHLVPYGYDLICKTSKSFHDYLVTLKKRIFQWSNLFLHFHYLPWPFIWTNLNFLHPRRKCTTFDWNWIYLFLEKIIKKTICCISILLLLSLGDRENSLHLNKLESSSHKDDLCQFPSLVKIGPMIWKSNKRPRGHIAHLSHIG